MPDFFFASDFAPIFLPVLSHALLTMSYMEGVAVSLDRASAARAANDEGHYFAQLRMSQRYAGAGSANLKKMQEARLSAAETLKGLSIETDEPEVIPRVRVAARLGNIRVESIRTRERTVIITYAEAIATQQAWRREGIDTAIRDMLERLTPNEGVLMAVIDSILDAEFARLDFDKSLSAILGSAELTQAEQDVAQTLDQWDSFYR